MMSGMRIRQLMLAVAGLCAVLFGAPAVHAADNGMMIHDAWVQFVPGTKATAAYFSLMNHGNKSQELVGAECDAFEKAELHTTSIHDGVATMAPLAQVEVAAMKTVKFAPGGMHVMLIGPKGSLKDGDKVELRLVFGDGSKVSAMATLKQAGTADHSEHKH